MYTLDYIVYGYPQTCRSEAARRVLDEATRYAGRKPLASLGG